MEIVFIIMLVMMAKHRRKRRRFRRYLRGIWDDHLSLGTLGAHTLVGNVLTATVNERTFLSSVRLTWNLSDYTPNAGDGPIEVGIAHSDYTDAEIEQVLENTDTWNEGNLVALELGKRKIRRVGMFPTPEAAGFSTSLNDGKPIHTKCGWILLQGQGVRVWAFNHGTSALATTVPVVHSAGHANLWPT